MRFSILLFCVVAFVSAETTSDLSDADIDITEILGNSKLVESSAKCLINKGPCTPEVKKFKERIPEILETRCAKCTEKQKQIGKLLTTEVRDKHPQVWKELVDYYDPQGKYNQNFEEFLKL